MRYRIGGIYREDAYLSDHAGNDLKIFNLTADSLQKWGFEITRYSESEFLQADIKENLIFSMARTSEVIEKLQILEEKGVVVVNSTQGVGNCVRDKMTTLLLANKVPHPESSIVLTDDFLLTDKIDIQRSYWIKRGDSHVSQRDDVVYVRTSNEAENALKALSSRGILKAVICEHLIGDIIKFYGVRDSNFFYWFYPDQSHSKFGLEKINGKPQGISFDLDVLKKIAQDSANILDVDIYGGDCVIDKYGTIKIIDFNDWPSFAPCRDEAAVHIANYIKGKLKI
ncbi:hypothetical protein LJB92_02545 [Bacteroidales bacterium OttesenSCG-928-M06]|nr:hypothetical protein [Bacteroidales bacterium OttesenSCG-928-M06]